MSRKLPTAVPVAALLVIVAPCLVLIFFVSTHGHTSFFLDALSSFASPSSSSGAPQLQAGSKSTSSSAAAAQRVPKGCDIFRGEWIPDNGAPYYTNVSCPLIQEHQNCLKYGRPDLGFLRWQWRPAGCEMPRFDAAAFLDAVRDRSLAFVGDSLARNHMQSLMCLLTKVEYPKDISETNDPELRTMRYDSYNFTIAIFWSPSLVQWNKSDDQLWHLHLDEPDGAWLAGVAGFDYVVLSAVNWYTRPSVFYEAGRLVGCHYCRVPSVGDLKLRYSQRMALRTALHAVATTTTSGFAGTVILRTLSPKSHFEGGEWDSDGDCRRTRPYAVNETRVAGLDLDFHTAQLEEFARAKTAGWSSSLERLMLMDTTPAMLLRPDGHPSRYGHRPEEKVTLYNDCVHWCLPGHVDVWNEMRFQMLLTVTD